MRQTAELTPQGRLVCLLVGSRQGVGYVAGKRTEYEERQSNQRAAETDMATGSQGYSNQPGIPTAGIYRVCPPYIPPYRYPQLE